MVDLLSLNPSLVVSLFPLLIEEWRPHILILEVPVDESRDLIYLNICPDILLADNEPDLLKRTNWFLVGLAKAVALAGHWVPELNCWVFLPAN